MQNTITIGGNTSGGDTGSTVECSNTLPLMLIAGPCAIESTDHALDMAGALQEITSALGIGFVYKSSFDKANRTSLSSFRGPGLDAGLKVLEAVKSGLKVPVLTDVHLPEQCADAASVVDVLQIPAFLCRQTDLLVAAAKTDAVVNVKKAQFLAPWDMQHVVQKVVSAGSDRIMLTERGTSFGYNTLVS
ncbi:MAG TPA: 3-deoxy-8-phosphooctulonate synthase, partial [Alphaproteobacteria bacterium]|nr:3-deoxy-8-phosphooctulonate synthase [Alphaproteobacteria bacterium]